MYQIISSNIQNFTKYLLIKADITSYFIRFPKRARFQLGPFIKIPPKAAYQL